MHVQTTSLVGVLLLQPQVHRDERGFFLESFHQQAFLQATGIDAVFVQDNHSHSRRGVLRGLHYQLPPQTQGKLVRIVQGRVWDVVVDVRRSSPTFGRWQGFFLDAQQHQQLWIPPGFAHGFVVLSDSADCLYKTTAYYAPACDRGIAWNDPELGITWPEVPGGYLLSEKDLGQPLLAQAQLPEHS